METSTVATGQACVDRALQSGGGGALPFRIPSSNPPRPTVHDTNITSGFPTFLDEEMMVGSGGGACPWLSSDPQQNLDVRNHPPSRFMAKLDPLE